MQPKEILVRSEPLLRSPEVRTMYDSLHQMLLQVMAAQGFGDRRAKSGDAELFHCQDGVELLGWDELFDPHTNQMMLLSLTMVVLLTGPARGRCSLMARIYYPDSDLSQEAYTILAIPETPEFDGSESAVMLLAQQVLERTSAQEHWLSWEAIDFGSWLEQVTTL